MKMPNLLRDASYLGLHFFRCIEHVVCFFHAIWLLENKSFEMNIDIDIIQYREWLDSQVSHNIGCDLGWLTLGAPTSRLHTSRYGALGVMNDFRGVTSAYGYGDSYLVTKLPHSVSTCFFSVEFWRKTKIRYVHSLKLTNRH